MPKLTYCTNVHPLNSFSQWKENILYFGPKIREITKKDTFAMGLWFNQVLAKQLIEPNFKDLYQIKQWLDEHLLSVYTLNAFPYGHFHDEVVKKKVYLPSWAETSRLNYTLSCTQILAHLMEDDYGSISTLPLGWKEGWTNETGKQATKNLITCVKALRALKQKTGKQIRLCLEPEPGCVLEFISEVTDYWNTWLRPFAEAEGVEQSILNEHLGVCYDTCHQAVQFEEPIKALKELQKHSIPLGKMQLSSALVFVPDRHKQSKIKRLTFAEKKFLHQTRLMQNGEVIRFDDLPDALDSKQISWNTPWRVHYHLPLYLQEVLPSDTLMTTIEDMKKAYRYACENQLCEHFEIETYTWSVLPAEIKPKDNEALAYAIAQEIKFVEALSESMGVK